MHRLALAGETAVRINGVGEVSLRDALLKHCEITTVSASLFKEVAERSGDDELKGFLGNDKHAERQRFLWGRQFIDLLYAYPQVRFNATELSTLLNRLQPRFYSLASSPWAHPREAHLTVGVVRYSRTGRLRTGVASGFLANRADSGHVPVFVQRSATFRLPSDPAVPIIMIGPGTGIAPFRGFLHERRMQGGRGKNWLFFGEQHAATDFYYREELLTWQREGVLTRLDVAFSRDQPEKRYVQHCMLEQGATLWAWIQEGASLYVCGDAQRMAKDVDTTLRQIVMRYGGFSEDNTRAYLTQLASEKRYLRDVY
ncbi:MAG: sulfite reductase flavoprotein subunit alpha [Candidatus Binatia bacterium]